MPTPVPPFAAAQVGRQNSGGHYSRGPASPHSIMTTNRGLVVVVVVVGGGGGSATDAKSLREATGETLLIVIILAMIPPRPPTPCVSFFCELTSVWSHLICMYMTDTFHCRLTSLETVFFPMEIHCIARRVTPHPPTPPHTAPTLHSVQPYAVDTS